MNTSPETSDVKRMLNARAQDLLEINPDKLESLILCADSENEDDGTHTIVTVMGTGRELVFQLARLTHIVAKQTNKPLLQVSADVVSLTLDKDFSNFMEENLT